MSQEQTAIATSPATPVAPSNIELAAQIEKLDATIRQLNNNVVKHIDAASIANLSVGDWIAIWLKQSIGMFVIAMFIGGCFFLSSLVLGGALLRR